MGTVRLFLCGDVMTGRGIDQILPHPCDPALHEGYVQSAIDYVRLAEQLNGLIPRLVNPAYIWGAAIEVWSRAKPDARIVNLETSITRSEDFVDKGINYRMSSRERRMPRRSEHRLLCARQQSRARLGARRVARNAGNAETS